MLTDWGAHHLDITQWALNTEHTGPKTIDGSKTVLPNIPGGYTTPKFPVVELQYPDDIAVEVVGGDEGILFEGETGRIFVNRGRITGKPIEDQEADSAAQGKTMDGVKALFKGNLAKLGDHMGNFFEGFKHNLPTVSDVEQPASHGQRLPPGKYLDPAGAQDPVGRRKARDCQRAEANSMLKRAAAKLPVRFPPVPNGHYVEQIASGQIGRLAGLHHFTDAPIINTSTLRRLLTMSRFCLKRRQFVQKTARQAAAATLPGLFTERASADESKNDRPIFGCIGFGAGYNSGVEHLGQGAKIAKRAQENGADVVALCDVFRGPMEKAKAEHFEKAEMYEDYRKLLDRKDIEAVTIGTPDHWHTAIALAALDAGKHVYCEKPLTLTIDEGKQICAAVKRTGKTFQVGTQQRGDLYLLFGRAVATVRSGQLGKMKKVTVHLPDHRLATAKPFEAQPGPDWV